jgi:hypothetical protein
MAQAALNIQKIKKDFAAEMKRRQEERQLKEDIATVEELNRRVQAVNEGKDRFYTEEESEVILKELGYYG